MLESWTYIVESDTSASVRVLLISTLSLGPQFFHDILHLETIGGEKADAKSKTNRVRPPLDTRATRAESATETERHKLMILCVMRATTSSRRWTMRRPLQESLLSLSARATPQISRPMKRPTATLVNCTTCLLKSRFQGQFEFLLLPS